MNKKKTLIIVFSIAVIILVGVIILTNYKKNTETENPVSTTSETTIIDEPGTENQSEFIEVDWSEYEANNNPEFNISRLQQETELIFPNTLRLCVDDSLYPCYDAAMTIEKNDVSKLTDQLTEPKWNKHNDFSSIPIWQKYNIFKGYELYEKSVWPKSNKKSMNTTYIAILPNSNPDKADVLITYIGD